MLFSTGTTRTITFQCNYTKRFFPENPFDFVICKMSAISLNPECVKRINLLIWIDYALILKESVCLTNLTPLFPAICVLIFLLPEVYAKPTYQLATEANAVRNVNENIAFFEKNTEVTNCDGHLDVMLQSNNALSTDKNISYSTSTDTEGTYNGRRRCSDYQIVPMMGVRMCLTDARYKAKDALENYVSTRKSEVNFKWTDIYIIPNDALFDGTGRNILK